MPAQYLGPLGVSVYQGEDPYTLSPAFPVSRGKVVAIAILGGSPFFDTHSIVDSNGNDWYGPNSTGLGAWFNGNLGAASYNGAEFRACRLTAPLGEITVVSGNIDTIAAFAYGGITGRGAWGYATDQQFDVHTDGQVTPERAWNPGGNAAFGVAVLDFNLSLSPPDVGREWPRGWEEILYFGRGGSDPPGLGLVASVAHRLGEHAAGEEMSVDFGPYDSTYDRDGNQQEDYTGYGIEYWAYRRHTVSELSLVFGDLTPPGRTPGEIAGAIGPSGTRPHSRRVVGG